MLIAVIPDSHANPEVNNDRFIWLGNLLLERQPDIIVNLGDQFDMESLCSYDRNKRAFEGRRYQRDIEIGIDASQKIFGPFNEFNNKRKNIRKAKLKEPRKIFTLGNHEFRIVRATENSPELYGLMGLDNLKLKEFGYEVYPFKQAIKIEGIWFSHYFPSGVKGDSISGFNIASNVLTKNMESSICGHSHLYDLAIRAKPDGRKQIGLNAGWYGTEPTYADATEQFWHSCITFLHDVHDGVFDIEMIGIDRIKQIYS